jgi:hypothetical protein
MISLVLPTRGRPALVARLFDSIAEKTRDLRGIEVVAYVDDDDTGSIGISETRFALTKIVGPRLTMGGYNTACLQRSKGSIIVLINDDMVVRTTHWDDLVRELDNRFEDKVYLGYGNDLFKGARLCTFPILSRRTCAVLGEPFPIAYKGAFIDYHLLDIFKRIAHAGYARICYLENLVFEHLHYRTGKASFDETYQKRGRYDDDPVFFRLRDSRSAGASALLGNIRGARAEPPAPYGGFEAPDNVLSAALAYGRRLLLDAELPLRWRGFLYAWFVGRFLASRGYFGARHRQ